MNLSAAKLELILTNLDEHDNKPRDHGISWPMLRALFVSILALTAMLLPAQQPASDASADLRNALIGKWTGYLEYRDYSEPATSTKRVQLPTWLTIAQAPEGLFMDYTYDDGPAKVLTEHSTLVVDAKTHNYKVVKTDAVAESYSMTGDDKLRAGRGEIVLTGSGVDNGKPSDVRITWTIRRNLLSWTEEVRPAGPAGQFNFRHRYIFTRAEAPQPTPRPAK